MLNKTDIAMAKESLVIGDKIEVSVMGSSGNSKAINVIGTVISKSSDTFLVEYFKGCSKIPFKTSFAYKDIFVKDNTNRQQKK